MIFDQLWKETTARFAKSPLYYGHGTTCADEEAYWLIVHVMGVDFDSAKKALAAPATPKQVEKVRALAKERIDTRKPLAYLLHEAYFAGLKLYVDEHVLVPRSPLAEMIQAKFAPWYPIKKDMVMLDLCTGSGCIAIAIAHTFPEAKIDATDISKGALAIAQKNVALHNLKNQVTLYESDVFLNVPKKQYDLIISNPPYVDETDIANMPTEYRHEPLLGLAAGRDGLNIARHILKDAKKYLKHRGLLIMEVGNSLNALLAAYPKHHFMMPSFEHGGEGVVLIYQEDL